MFGDFPRISNPPEAVPNLVRRGEAARHGCGRMVLAPMRQNQCLWLAQRGGAPVSQLRRGSALCASVSLCESTSSRVSSPCSIAIPLCASVSLCESTSLCVSSPCSIAIPLCASVSLCEKTSSHVSFPCSIVIPLCASVSLCESTSSCVSSPCSIAIPLCASV